MEYYRFFSAAGIECFPLLKSHYRQNQIYDRQSLSLQAANQTMQEWAENYRFSSARKLEDARFPLWEMASKTKINNADIALFARFRLERPKDNSFSRLRAYTFLI